MLFKDLRHEQARQTVDVEQIFSAYSAAKAELDTRFEGSMFWREIGPRRYLYRKHGTTARSLGAQSIETEKAHAAFVSGRERVRERVQTLAARLNEMAPVNRALGLGRMPLISARILRRLGAAGLVGKAVVVTGTTALYAYERMAGVQVEGGLLATGDIDLLFDARRRLKLAAEAPSGGLLDHLRRVDRSFEASRGSFRAINRDGFMVDLIQPLPRNRLASGGRASIGDHHDLQAVEIEGLGWLVNSPKHDVVVIDERGFPVEVSIPDPRAFALHKAWLSERDDRDPIKRGRDMGQARLVARLVTERLRLSFDSDELTALPADMRRTASRIVQSAELSAPTALEPDW